MRWRHLALLTAGLAFGAGSLAIARSAPAYSFGGGSAVAGVAELIGGYALLAVGVAAWARRRQRRLGAILVAASFAWFLLEWNNPGAHFAAVFTVGLALYTMAPPLIAHAMLSYPDGRIRSRLNRLGVAIAYASAVLVLGVLPAFAFDPAAAGCGQCPRNLLLIDGSSGAYEGLSRAGVHLGVAWAVLLIVLAAAEAARSTPARRRQSAPVLIAGSLYLALVAAHFANSLDRGFLGNDAGDRRLWYGEAAALLGLALGIAAAWFRARRARAEVARLVIELAESPAPGRLGTALARSLGDPSVELGYPLGDGRIVDVDGRPVELAGDVTPIVRGGRQVALLSHRPGLLDDPALVDEVGAAARLALENEWLRAEVRSQLEDLRASRARIVETGDTERRRLERDLHDAAQQRLVGLLLSLRLARSKQGPEAEASRLARIDEAEAELQTALAELRELAHGIFPAALADEGLAAALETLAESAAVPIEVAEAPDRRFDPAVEAAAYFVVSEAVERDLAGPLKVTAACRGGRLVVEVEGDRAPEGVAHLEDRVGAIDGTLEVVPDPAGRVTIRAELPCES